MHAIVTLRTQYCPYSCVAYTTSLIGTRRQSQVRTGRHMTLSICLEHMITLLREHTSFQPVMYYSLTLYVPTKQLYCPTTCCSSHSSITPSLPLPSPPSLTPVFSSSPHHPLFSFFFFNNPAPPEISPLPLHAPLPISRGPRPRRAPSGGGTGRWRCPPCRSAEKPRRRSVPLQRGAAPPSPATPCWPAANACPRARPPASRAGPPRRRSPPSRIAPRAAQRSPPARGRPRARASAGPARQGARRACAPQSHPPTPRMPGANAGSARRASSRCGSRRGPRGGSDRD